MHGKSLIWFVASIIYSIIFSSTKTLRVKDTKNFTFNSMVERIKGIVADRDFKIKKYQRRYRLDSKQKNIFDIFSIEENDIDKIVSNMIY